jgi:RTX calcium-binding nonapeptide repeat (4 copies)
MRLLGIALAALVLTGTAVARTIEGTARNDRIVGTPRADSIFGREGADQLLGMAGPDFLLAGTGSDLVEGGAGNDRIAVQYDGGRDRVRCGAGLDVVNADLLDTVATDCELVAKRLSRDPYTGPDSQHETEVEPDSLTIGRTTVVTFQVGRRSEGAADNVGFAVSNDDGRTWRSGLLPGLTQASVPAGPNERASDPVVAYDAANRVWLISTLAIEGPVTRLTISRSADGFAWSNPVTANEDASSRDISFDKEWIGCDNGAGSPFRGRCYLAYSDILRGNSIGVQSSSDGGSTWSVPTQIPVRDAVGAFPAIRPTGELLVVSYVDPNRIVAALSTDGGQTFRSPVTVVDAEACRVRRFRSFPLPSADVDPQGRFWVTWHQCTGTASSDNDVFVSTSADGIAWSLPQKVTSGRNALMPAIGIHPSSGRVAIAYYVAGSRGIDFELIETRAGGSGWGAPRRLSAQTMRLDWLPNTSSGRMLADYVSVHYAGSRPLAVWVLASEPVGSSYRQAVYATRAG